MGVTLILAIALWLAGAFVEYKIIKDIPALQPLFKGIPGIVISIAISLTLGFFIAPAAGVAVALAATLGMATNEFTYKLFSKTAKLNERRAHTTAKVKTFKDEHPTVFNEAVEGLKAGVKVIVGFVLAIVWICGLPVRIYNWCLLGTRKVKTAFHG